MRVVLLVIVVLCLAAVQAEVSGSSKLPSATSKSYLKKRQSVSQGKVESVSVVGAAAKAAAPAFDMKAAGQLAATFSVWYGFNAACKCTVALERICGCILSVSAPFAHFRGDVVCLSVS